MSRTSISFTEPNEQWIQAQIESQEFTSKSDVVNDLIRRMRREQAEIEYVRQKLIKAEKSGFTKSTMEEILAESKAELRRDGKL